MSDLSPNLALPLLLPAQAQKHVTHNEALALLDLLVQLRVQRFDARTPPEAPGDGLTDPQREALRTAYEMGYFEYPRDANASEVAAALDIQRSTFTEHLNAAQSKLLDELQFASPDAARS